MDLADIGTITVQVEKDGELIELAVNLDPNKLTLQESVRLEKRIGRGRMSEMLRGVELEVDLELFQLLLWTKVYTQVPGIEPDGFDLELAAMAETPTVEDDLTVDELEAALMSGDDGVDLVEAARGKR